MINNITGKLIQTQLCNIIWCPHGMLCNNARNYVTEEIIQNQFCNVKDYYVIGESHSKQHNYVIGLTPEYCGKRPPEQWELWEGGNPWNRTISTVLRVHKKLPQSTVKLVLPSNESYESKTGCNRTLATVLWVPLSNVIIWPQWQILSVAPPAEPRGENKLFFVQILGGEKLLKFGEKWAVKKF